MDSVDTFRERIEALEQRTEQGHQHTHALEAHTRMAARWLRWWRDIVCGLVMLGLLSWALPPGAAQDLLQQPSQTLRALEPSRHVTRQMPYGRLLMSFEANRGQTDDQV